MSQPFACHRTLDVVYDVIDIIVFPQPTGSFQTGYVEMKLVRYLLNRFEIGRCCVVFIHIYPLSVQHQRTLSLFNQPSVNDITSDSLTHSVIVRNAQTTQHIGIIWFFIHIGNRPRPKISMCFYILNIKCPDIIAFKRNTVSLRFN